LALFSTSSGEPEKGILKLHDIFKTKIYMYISYPMHQQKSPLSGNFTKV